MADEQILSIAEKDKKAVERFNRLYKESIIRERRLNQHWEWRGGKYPPFSIEPMPRERERLATKMTPEQRAMRKQWVIDQRLAPHEPVYIPELTPQNPIRRMAAAPWNFMFTVVEKITGPTFAGYGRWYAPRITMGLTVALFMYYHQKYNPSNWEGKKGWHTIMVAPAKYPGDASYPKPTVPEDDFFYDRGFKNRSVKNP